jgi:enterochelin esterase-like enzyme
VYLPHDYDNGDERYCVVYLNDGQAWLTGVWDGPQLQCDLTYDALFAAGLVKAAIFVAIDFRREGRIRDLTPAEDGEGNLEGYSRFVSERLKPYIDARFRTNPDPASTAIVGISMGGLASFLMAHRHPETFGMAACMSPSFWHGDRCAIELLRSDRRGKQTVRFWMDAGGSEYGAWRDIRDVTSILEQRGWTNGQELAAHFDYTGEHAIPAWRDRIWRTLYFLLHKDPLRLEDFRLVSAVRPSAPSMDLRNGLRRIVGAEAWYENGLRLNLPHPMLTVDDPSVVSVDDHDPALLQPVGTGQTTVRSTYGGLDAFLPVITAVPDSSQPLLPCLRDQFDLPYNVLDADLEPVGRLGVRYDDEHLYLRVETYRKTEEKTPTENPFEQSHFRVCLDARPESVLCRGDGYDNGEPFLRLAIGPGPEVGSVAFRSSEKGLEWSTSIPTGIDTACEELPYGYRLSLTIHRRLLDVRQGSSWQVFRLNIGISVRSGGATTTAWWQPEWHLFESPIASGIFERRLS